MILDIEKLENRIKKVVSTEESLEDVEPYCWDDEILSGEKESKHLGLSASTEEEGI